MINAQLADRSHRFSRSMGLVKPEDLAKIRICLIGAGSIGSFTAATLARMGISQIKIWDADKVEVHNLGCQDFPEDSLGQHKVAALEKRIKEIDSKIEVSAFPEMWTGQRLSGIVICAVDSMEARRKVWQEVKMNSAVTLLIDPRMGGYVGGVFSFVPTQSEFFKDYAEQISSEGVSELACTERSLIFNVAGIASIVAGIVARFVNKYEIPYEVRADFRNLTWETREKPAEVASGSFKAALAAEAAPLNTVEEVPAVQEDTGVVFPEEPQERELLAETTPL